MCFGVKLNNLTRAIPPLLFCLITLVCPRRCLEEGKKVGDGFQAAPRGAQI